MPIQDQLPALFHQLGLGDNLQPEEYDLAECNLMLANGLPGAENLDVPHLLNTIDEWAEQVRLETQRSYHRFLDSPADYQNSQGYFCVLVLVTVLERDLGVGYNPERVRDQSFQDPFCVDPDFKDSRDLFIHGILDGPGGTCASMPVIYTAVGRRLGYPMKLVEAPGHLFSRWDDPQGKFNRIPDRFNIDAAGHGFACFPDEHYMTWPRPWKDVENENGWYLKSLTPFSEMAAFLATRGSCLEDNGRIQEAFLAFHWAYKLTKDKRYYGQAAKFQHRLQTEEKERLEYANEMEDQRRLRQDRLENQQGGFLHNSSCLCKTCKAQLMEETKKMKINSGHAQSCQCQHCKEDRQAASKQNVKPNQFQPKFP